MPGLLTLQTDLKSLKYGQDRPNGGSSGQPYIQTDIRTVDATFGGVNLTLYDDGLVRGGMVAATNASAIDTVRIAKFFTDPPKGPLFLAKQVGLQLSNPQLEKKGTTTERYVGPSRIYNLGINTLAQVPLVAFGEHLLRHGLLPINDPDTYYEAVVTNNNFQSNNNRLEKYAKKFSLGGLDSIIKKSNWNTDLELNKYVSGPNSIYGIGNTVISRYTNTNDKIKIDAAFDRSKSLAGKLIDDDGNIFNTVENRFLGVSNFSSSSFVLGNSFNLDTPSTLDNRNSVVNLNDDKAGKYKILLPPVKIIKTYDFGLSNQSGSVFNNGRSFDLLGSTINANTEPFNFIGSNNDKVQDRAGLLISEDGEVFNTVENRFLGVSNFSSSSFVSGDNFALGVPLTLDDRNSVVNATNDKSGTYKIPTEPVKITQTVDFGISNKTETIFNNGKKFNLIRDGINENTPAFFFVGKESDRVNNLAGLSQETKDALKVSTTADFGLSKKTSSTFVNTKFNLLKEVNDNTPLFNFIAKKGDGKHNRDGELPALSNNNDLVKSGPSSFPGAGEEGLTRLDLPQTAYRFTNPTIRTYAVVAGQNSKVTNISQTTPGPEKFTTQNVSIDRGSPTYQYNTGTKILFNRDKGPGSDIDVNNDALALVFRPIRPFTAAEDEIKFLAYMTDYKDNFESNWNDIKYVGRAEKFYIFNEFKRSISLGFNIPCFNKTELQEKHKQLNQLVSILAGEYSGGLLGGIITKLTVGNYIANQPGIITGMDFSPIDESSWDLDDKLAFYIKVSFNFTLIHDGLQQYNYDFIKTA